MQDYQIEVRGDKVFIYGVQDYSDFDTCFYCDYQITFDINEETVSGSIWSPRLDKYVYIKEGVFYTISSIKNWLLSYDDNGEFLINIALYLDDDFLDFLNKWVNVPQWLGITAHKYK